MACPIELILVPGRLFRGLTAALWLLMKARRFLSLLSTAPVATWGGFNKLQRNAGSFW